MENMENRFLDSKNGLSSTDASSISNLCNQRSRDITSELNSKNNYSSTFRYEGETYVDTEANAIDSDKVVEMLTKKGRLHALQAIIMEGIKLKQTLMEDISNEVFVYDVIEPEYPKLVSAETESPVEESWGWSRLTSTEIQEYLYNESMASHIGQFIHRGGKLDTLRKELENFKPLDFITIKDGVKTPVKKIKHHTSEELLKLHEELSAKHREFEKKVNYYKAKVKNLVSEENIRINEENKKAIAIAEEENSKIRNEYNNESKKYLAEKRKAYEDFESDRSKRLNLASKLKIVVPKDLQDLVDELRPK